MCRWKNLIWIVVLISIPAWSWAQGKQSLLVAEDGFLIERSWVSNAVEDIIVPVNGSVMYAYGRSATDGKILFAVWDETVERMNLAMAEFDGSEQREVATDVVYSMWSPSGDRFLYYDVNGDLYLSEGNDARRIAQGVAAASFAPNERWLAMVRTPELNPDGRRDPGLWLFELATGKEQRLTERFNENWSLIEYAPYWTLDSQSIIFVADDGPTPFWSINLSGGEAQPIQASAEISMPATPLFWSPDGRRAFFGVETLDGPDHVWLLDFGPAASNQTAQASIVAEGTPIGFVSGPQLLLTTESGLVDLNAETLEARPVAGAPVEEEATALGVSGLYRVKFYSPLVSWRISSWFSHNRNRTDGGPYRYNCVNFGRRGHRGTDMATSLGRTIYAGASGVVESVTNGCGYRDRCASSNFSCGGGFGNHVRIRHSNGVRSFYAHMRATAIRSGRSVNCHSVLGHVGSTGHSFGCHVHFELRTSGGRSVDPYRGNCNWISASLWTSANNPRRCR